MSDQEDPIDEAIQTSLRMGMMMAGQMGRAAGQVWEAVQKQNAHRSTDERRAVDLMFQAEHTTAMTALKQTEDPAWVDHASNDDLYAAYRHAEAWRGIDPDAARASDRLEQQISERFGISGSELRSGAAQAEAEAVRERQIGNAAGADEQLHERAATSERAQAREVNVDHASGAGVDGASVDAVAIAPPTVDSAQPPGEAPTAERAASVHEGQAAASKGVKEQAYNSSDRLESVAAQMRGQGRSEEAVKARVHADSTMKHGPDHAAAVGRSAAKVDAGESPARTVAQPVQKQVAKKQVR
jgi:hypothetical protein